MTICDRSTWMRAICDRSTLIKAFCAVSYERSSLAVSRLTHAGARLTRARFSATKAESGLLTGVPLAWQELSEGGAARGRGAARLGPAAPPPFCPPAQRQEGGGAAGRARTLLSGADTNFDPNP